MSRRCRLLAGRDGRFLCGCPGSLTVSVGGRGHNAEGSLLTMTDRTKAKMIWEKSLSGSGEKNGLQRQLIYLTNPSKARFSPFFLNAARFLYPKATSVLSGGARHPYPLSKYKLDVMHV